MTSSNKTILAPYANAMLWWRETQYGRLPYPGGLKRIKDHEKTFSDLFSRCFGFPAVSLTDMANGR